MVGHTHNEKLSTSVFTTVYFVFVVWLLEITLTSLHFVIEWSCCGWSPRGQKKNLQYNSFNEPNNLKYSRVISPTFCYPPTVCVALRSSCHVKSGCEGNGNKHPSLHGARWSASRILQAPWRQRHDEAKSRKIVATSLTSIRSHRKGNRDGRWNHTRIRVKGPFLNTNLFWLPYCIIGFNLQNAFE